MVFSGITATEAQIDQKAGANVNTSFDGDMKKEALLQAENDLNSVTLFDCTGAYGTWSVKAKHAITSITASQAAIDAINYDIDAIGRGAASLMLNVLTDRVVKGTNKLKDKNYQKFLAGLT